MYKWWWIATLAAACSRPAPERLTDCADSACQQAWVLERWPKDQDAVLNALHELDDPVAVVALSRTLTTAFPGTIQRLCDVLPPGPAQQDCRDRNMRPHLQDLTVPADGAVADDPEGEQHRLGPTVAVTSPWTAVAGAELSCGPLGRVCQATAALDRAADGDLAAAAAACNAISDRTWRAECYFQAAEAGVKGKGEQPGEAVGLCLGASTFAGRCLTHVLRELGTRAPRAGAADREGWDIIVKAQEASTRALSVQDPPLAASFRGQLWAYSARFSYAQDLTVTLAPLDLLPEEAAPHVRAAAAWRVWGLESGPPRDLAGWEARLAELAATRSSTPRPGRAPEVRHGSRWMDLWRTSYQGEDKLPRVFFLGPVYRASSADPSEDLLICLLEAAARGQPPGRTLLGEALDHPSALVRWTAVRLLQGVDPRNALLRERSKETDALVRARLDRRR